MSATDYIKIRGIKSTDGPPSKECFEGIGFDGELITTPGTTPGVELGGTTEPTEDETFITETIEALNTMLEQYAQDSALEVDPDNPNLPSPIVDKLKTFTALMLFIVKLLSKVPKKIDRVESIATTIHRVIQIFNETHDYLVNTDIQNSFLEYDPLDVLRLFPKSIIKQILDALSQEEVLDLGFAKYYRQAKIVEY